MIVIAFIAFAALVAAWLIAPNGEPASMPELSPAPPVPLGDAPAPAN